MTNTKQLCKGFLATRIDREAGEIKETRYAKLPDGSVLKSDESRRSDDFEKGHVFRKTSMTGEDITAMVAAGEIEFIGNYPIPKAA